MTDLLPCPHCGGKAELHTNQIAEDVMEAFVMCSTCFATTDDFEDACAPTAEAIAAWNRRSSPAREQVTEALPLTDVEIENALEDAAKAAFTKAQSVYRADHDHFPLKSTWETTDESIRDGWRAIARSAIEAAEMPPLGTQPEPRRKRPLAVIQDALSPSPTGGEAGAVAVKPLRWPPECPRGQRVHGRGAPFEGVEYCIAHYGGGLGDHTVYRWAAPKGKWSEPFDSYESAKAAAQADYERRILSALTRPAPLMDEVGWRDMDSAPKDGSAFLAWDGFSVFLCFFNGGSWQDQPTCSPRPHAKVWMPLPPAPALTKLQEGGR